MKRFSTYDELSTIIDDSDGVATILMEDLRNAHEVKKLGVTVRENIAKKLQGRGLGFVGKELPGYQDQSVRIYRLGTPVADLINAVMNPGVEHDIVIRGSAHNEAQETLNRIKEALETT